MKKKRKVAAGSTSRSSGLLAAARFIEGEQREWGDTMGLRWFRRLDRMVQACRDATNSPLCPKTDSKHSTLQIEEKKK